MKHELYRGSIIQANEHASPEWCGCVLIVEEAKEDGRVLAFMRIPGQGDAYIFLNKGEYDDLYAGANLLPVKEEDPE